MEANDSQSSPKADNKTVDTSQPHRLVAPDQVVSESGTVRGIKGRVKEQIASNQSKIMVQGLMKKQQPFSRTPLAVIHKAGSLDQPQEANFKTSLRRSGSQEEVSNQESENVIKRSNSLKINEAEQQNDGKQKPRGKAPPPPQDKVKAKQPQQVEYKPLDHQSIIAPPQKHDTIPAGDSQVVHQNSETLTKQMAPNFSPTNKTITTTPDAGKKIPPKVKPKTVKTKSKEAEDEIMAVPKAPFEAPSVAQSTRHPNLSKRAKSESHLKSLTKFSPKIDKKPAAIIESSDDGQQVLVLSPSGSKTNKDTSVRIFLPPPPPVLPPCQEQESENNTKHTQDYATTSNSERKSVTNNKIGTTESTVASQSHSDNTITTDPTVNKVEYNETDHGLHPQQQQKNENVSHLPSSNNLEVDSEMEAIEQLPHILFHSAEDLPPTPPGSPCNELESAEMKTMESELNGDDDDDDDDVVPPPPPMDDFNTDYTDGMISPLPPPPDDFDPLSLPPPLPLDDNIGDDIFDIIPPPSSSSIEDDDITAATTEVSTQPFEDNEAFKDFSTKLSRQQANDKAPEYGSDDENIMLNLLPDDVSSSESDAEQPVTLTENIISEVESTEPETAAINVVQADDEKHVSQPDIKDESITGELESVKPELSVDAKTEGHKETVEMQQSQDELSNIIASLETMLQDEPSSHEEEIVEDTEIKLPSCTDWVEPYKDQPTEASADDSKDDVLKTNGSKDSMLEDDSSKDDVLKANGSMLEDNSSKDDVLKANLNQQPINNIGQTISVIPKVDTAETINAKPPPAAPLPVRAAPPPPPLPPIGKTPQKMVTSSNNTTSPTKAKSPPPAVKPKPKRPLSGPLVEEFQDELAQKLKRRQQKIHDWAKDDNKPKPPPQTAPTILATVPSATKTKTATLNTAPGMPNLQVTSGSSLQGTMPVAQLTTSPTGTQEQMEQIQLLQNQILQQQILQLQQQLQQLQQQMPQGQVAGNPAMTLPQIVPQAATGMQIPQVGIGMQTGSGMEIPQAANFMQASQLNTGMQIPMQQQSGIPIHNPSLTTNDKRTINATNTPKTAGLNTSTSDSTYSETPPPLPVTSPPPLDYDQVTRRSLNKSISDPSLHQRPRSQVLRSKAVGEYEDALDDIMEEVREVDHNTVLRKVSTTHSANNCITKCSYIAATTTTTT